MTRYIDADALIGALHNHAFLEGDDRSICYNIIQKQPTIEAVPVIRCNDCIHCADDWNGNQPTFTCELGRAGESVQPNDYCSYAERRGEE